MSRSILVLMLAVGVVGANGLMLSPIAAEVARSFAGAGPADVLLAAAVYGLGTAASALVLAPMADRYGADRALSVAFLALVAGFAGSALAPALRHFWLAQGLTGIATGVALPAIYALAAHAAPPGREAKTMGTVLTGWTLSLVAGVTFAAFLAEFLGWRLVYGALAGATALVWLALRACAFGAPRSGTSSPLTALRVPGIRRALAMMGALMLAFYMTYTFMGTHITGALARSTASAGLLPLSYGLGFGASMFLDPYLDRLGPSRAATPLYVATAGLYGAMALVSGQFAGVIAIGFVWGITQHLCLNLSVGRLTALDPAQRGAILGLSSTVTYLAVFGGAVLGRPIFAAGGLSALALCAAALLALMAIESRVRGAWSVPLRRDA